MRKKDEEIPLLFKDREKDDIISPDYLSILIQKAKQGDKNSNNIYKDPNAQKNENNEESNKGMTQEHDQLNIITTPHSVLFILFISLLIGLSLNTLLSFVFPIYTESSFQDQIPDDLNIHGFKVGSAYFDGIVHEVNQTKYVNIEIPSGITIDLASNTNKFYVSTTDTLLFTNSNYNSNPSFTNPSFINMETKFVQSSPLNISSNHFIFESDILNISKSFQIMGKINCRSLIYKEYYFSDDGTCMRADSLSSFNLKKNSQNIKDFLQNLQPTEDFGYVKSFSISYPYIATLNDQEMRIYKYENENQFLIGSIKGKGSLFKNRNSNAFIFGQNSYHILNDKIEKISSIHIDIDYENETTDNDGNKILVFFDEIGINYLKCNGLNCNQKESLLLYNFSIDSINSSTIKPFDLKISFDLLGAPVVTSDLLKMAFVINKDKTFETIIIDVDEAHDIRMLSYSNQLLFLTNHTLNRYLI